MGTQKTATLGQTLIIGGAMRDRTADLFTASEALSQLSYSPNLINTRRNNYVVYCLVRGAFYAPPKIKSTVFYPALFKWFNFQQTGYQAC
jgi:hypothetical protein